jgi:hypothetical protein
MKRKKNDRRFDGWGVLIASTFIALLTAGAGVLVLMALRNMK